MESSSGIEAFSEVILPQFAQINVMPVHVVISGPMKSCVSAKLHPTIMGKTSMFSSAVHQRVQFTGNLRARDACIGYKAQVLIIAFVIHWQHLKLERCGECIRHKIQGPTHAWAQSQGNLCL
jgi:hypothetical protein